MSSRFFCFGLVAALAVVMHVQAGAQAPSAAAEAPAASRPTPRTADGHPDLSGIWGSGGGEGPSNAVQKGNTLIVLFPLEGADPFEGTDLFRALDRRGTERKAAAPNKPPYKPELAAKLKENSDLQSRRDPAFYCKPEGVPRMGPPNQIVQTPGQVVFLYENRNTFRVIPTDGRPHRDDVDPSWMGDSVARWEGDTLVVDVTQFTDESWLNADGWFHSDAMHVVERLQRNGDELIYSATVEDPVVLTGPWELTPRTLRIQTERSAALMESPPCVERSAPNMVTDDHH
ncbi:MAG TPA: hypothetical protein VM818_19340 [Vicinamibacterales bacterium]|nr:hypothetical protein [Vicinamibacterales bacterium]